MAPSGLPIDRSLSNHAFGSWRLDSSAAIKQSSHQLPGRVQTVSAGGEGFLQTRTVVQHNHLHQLASGIYVFLQQGDAPPALFRIEYRDDADGVATHRLTGLNTHMTPENSPLKPSIWGPNAFVEWPAAADVWLYRTFPCQIPYLCRPCTFNLENFLAGPLDGQEEAEATGGLLEPRLPPTVAAVATASGGHSRPHKALLVSSGHGDLQLVSDDLQAVGSGTAH